MDARRQLFLRRKVYDLPGTDELFIRAVRENVQWHLSRCEEYRTLLRDTGFCPEQLNTLEDLALLPPISTLYLKQRQLQSLPSRQLHYRSTTSGTSGHPVEVGFDTGSLLLGAKMLCSMLRCHHLFSPRLTNYLILGYQPSSHNRMGAVRTAYGATFLAPALHREYALRDTGSDYELNTEGVYQALLRYSRGSAPVRILGFPAYFYFLLQKLEQDGVTLKLPPRSTVMLGGGWKQFTAQTVPKTELYRLSSRHLGISEEQFLEFFGVVEHDVPYFDCPNHHFHVPIYSRVLIRDVRTMQPVGYQKPGILNLITPFLRSMPLVSILTDDIAVLHEGRECGCGNPAPYFELLGRAGLQGIRTCAAGASSLLEGLAK